ncbi:MAG: sugar transferase [Chloroflexi bacterium]|nr:sugar transferase [Chloroflexota bacterium]
MIRASTITKSLLNNPEKTDTISQKETATGQSSRLGRILKASFDYMVTIPGLLLISPLFLALALLVRLDSPGPVFYRRRVLGKSGRVYYAFKFRTMYVNGDEILAQYPKLRRELDKNYKLKCDPRITKVGNFLRKYSLDELPQLLNVLNQDMSLIGPRMITPEEISKYGEHGEKLMTVMPGLSGLWQVSGRSDTTYDERIQLDMAYVENWSVMLDLKILFQTPMIVLRGDGAY